MPTVLCRVFSLCVLFVFAASCSQAQPEQPPVVATSTSQDVISFGHRESFASEVLGETKMLYVSLPPLYNEHVHSYPLVLVLEAEFLFEPARAVSNLMAARSKMPESIIVGITNGEFDKRRELSYPRWGGIPEKHLQFYQEELIPYLERTYRLNDHRTLVGLSPTCGVLYEAFLNQPDLFDAYLALSAHLEWDRVEGTPLFEEITGQNANTQRPRATFYLGRSRNDFSTFRGSEEAFAQAQTFLQTYQPNRVNIKVEVLDEEEHYLMALAGLRSGFEAIYPNTLWRNPGFSGWDTEEDYAQTYYREYYKGLSEHYGFAILPVETAHGYGYSFSGRIHGAKRWGTPQQVLSLAELGVSYFPNSAHLWMTLAETQQAQGNLTKVTEAGQKALTLAEQYRPAELTQYQQRWQAMDLE
ncbi:MAG: alpha/beta hydrolase-fold protein [Bacteroidota bacterium]